MNYRQKFKYGNTEVTVFVEFSKRKHISLTVYPNLRVVARVPMKSRSERIESIIQKKLRWITKKLDYFDALDPILPPQEFVSGETHYYLGRPYRLKIQTDIKVGIEIIAGFIELKLPVPAESKKVKKILLDWYKIRAKELLVQRTEKFLPDFLGLGAAKPDIKFRKMKTRWGSCSKKNVITLNTELIKASGYCIDYVVVHELCHLIHLGHNKKFYNLLQNQMPDWKERKKLLERVVLG